VGCKFYIPQKLTAGSPENGHFAKGDSELGFPILFRFQPLVFGGVLGGSSHLVSG